MKQLLLTLLLSLTTLGANSQIREDLVRLLYQHKYEELIANGHSYLAKDPNDASACEIMGAAFFETNRNDSAVYYLNRSLDIDKEKTLTSCWDHIYLGKYYHLVGDYEKAKNELEKSINKKATKKMRKYSSYLLASLGLDNYYNNWIVTETQHIVFHVQDTSVFANFTEHVNAHEDIYTDVNSLLKTSSDKRLHIYYWKDKSSAEKLLGAQPPINSLHQYLAHAVAPDSMHRIIMYAILYSKTPPFSEGGNQLIYYGICAAFDSTVSDKYTLAKKAVESLYVGDIKNVWKNPSMYGHSVLLSISEALVFYLKEKSTPEQFEQLIKNQSIESAKSIYGDSFDGLMANFNTGVLGIK